MTDEHPTIDQLRAYAATLGSSICWQAASGIYHSAPVAHAEARSLRAWYATFSEEGKAAVLAWIALQSP